MASMTMFVILCPSVGEQESVYSSMTKNACIMSHMLRISSVAELEHALLE